MVTRGILSLKVGATYIRMYSRDHEPQHIHAVCAAKKIELKIDLFGKILKNEGFGAKDIKVIREFIERNRKTLLELWYAIQKNQK